MGGLTIPEEISRGTGIIDLDVPDEVFTFHTDRELTVESIVAATNGVSTPSVDWTIRYDADRDALGTELATDGFTTTATDLETILAAALDVSVIPADVWIWVEATAVSGDATRLEFQINWA
jgi:hypothetical protein